MNQLLNGRHVPRLRRRRRRAYTPTSNTASHDNHEKINSWVSFCFPYMGCLWGSAWRPPEPRYDCKLFFRLDGTCNSIVELSNSAGWDFELTIKFNASTGEEYCEWFVCGVCGTEVAFYTKQAEAGSFTVSSLFFPRPASCSRQFTPNGSNFA